MPDSKTNKGSSKTKAQDTEKTVHDLTKREDLTQVLDQSLHALQEMEQRLQMLEQELGRIGNPQNPSQSPMGTGFQGEPGNRAQASAGQAPTAQSFASAPVGSIPGAPSPFARIMQPTPAYGAQGHSVPPQAAFAQPPSGISPWPANYPMYQAASGAAAQPTSILPASGAGSSVSEAMQVGQHGDLSNSGIRNEAPSEMNPSVREPNMDVVDSSKEFCIHWELPGVKKEDVDIMVTDKSVILNAKALPNTGDGIVVHTERPPTVYRRTVPFQTEVDTGSAKASLKDGILTVHIPKRTPTAGPKHLDVAYG